MDTTEFSVAGQHVVVVGAARSGIAAAELLARRGARVTLTDQRDTVDAATRLGWAGVDLELGGHTAATLASADLVVVSPGVSLDQPVFDGVRQRKTEIIGELELAYRWLKGPVIAITGTKGKSTTTTLIGRMLSADGRKVLVGGNIGTPLSAQVEKSTPDTVHVVEVSSFQLETASTFHAWIALWLNLADDHLDRHASLDAYADAKARVFTNQRRGDWTVVNADDPIVMERSATTAATRVSFSLAGHVPEGFIAEDGWIVRRTTSISEPLFPISAIELTGRHMIGNVIAATAVAYIADVRTSSMVEGLRGFRGLEHVMEPVGSLDGVRFVNDSKATNVEAALRSIESFDRGVVAILGGRFKSGDLTLLTPALKAHGRAVVAIGEAAPLVRAALSGVVPIVEAASMGEAVERGYQVALPDGVVLLAPACASFDWFRDYAERGRAFKSEVERLRERSK